MNRAKPLYLLSGCSYHHRKTRDPLVQEVFREGRVDNLGDIAPAFVVQPSDYEYQI